MDFTRESVVSAFTEVGERLFQRRKVGDIAVFGGSAMILQFDVDFVTHDVDAVIDSEHGEVIAAVHDVARRRGWESSWLNEGVSVYLSQQRTSATRLYGEFPSAERVGLRVYVATAPYLLAMKLQAFRVGRRDVDDIVVLARHLGLSTVDELAEVAAVNFPDHPLDQRKRRLLGDLIARLVP